MRLSVEQVDNILLGVELDDYKVIDKKWTAGAKDSESYKEYFTFILEQKPVLYKGVTCKTVTNALEKTNKITGKKIKRESLVSYSHEKNGGVTLVKVKPECIKDNNNKRTIIYKEI